MFNSVIFFRLNRFHDLVQAFTLHIYLNFIPCYCDFYKIFPSIHPQPVRTPFQSQYQPEELSHTLLNKISVLPHIFIDLLISMMLYIKTVLYIIEELYKTTSHQTRLFLVSRALQQTKLNIYKEHFQSIYKVLYKICFHLKYYNIFFFSFNSVRHSNKFYYICLKYLSNQHLLYPTSKSLKKKFIIFFFLLLKYINPFLVITKMLILAKLQLRKILINS